MPIEYRPYVEEGIREKWNKLRSRRSASRTRSPSAGRRPERDEFDPEDTRYCTFRWVTSDMGYARSCLRANPMTGEMIDGDVVFDAGFIRHWKQQYALLIASKTGADGGESSAPLALGEVISPILASRMGYGQPATGDLLGIEALQPNPGRIVAEVIPSDQNLLAWELARNAARSSRGFCELQLGMQRDLALAAMVMAGEGGPTPAGRPGRPSC